MSVSKQLIIYSLLLAAGCGKENVADCDKGRKEVPCSARTDDENARLALDNGDFGAAITLLDGLIAKEPANVARFPLAAAAHAGRAGISILSLAKAQFSGGGASLLDSISAFLPDPKELGDAGYDAACVDMAAAVARLTAIPAEQRATTSTEKYAASALLQLGLYQTVYSVMYLNKFAISATTGQLDIEKLSTMSDADAAIVIDNLAAVAQGQAAGNPALQAQVNEALATIQGSDGASNKEKLKAFLEKQNLPANTPTPASPAPSP